LKVTLRSMVRERKKEFTSGGKHYERRIKKSSGKNKNTKRG